MDSPMNLSNRLNDSMFQTDEVTLEDISDQDTLRLLITQLRLNFYQLQVSQKLQNATLLHKIDEVKKNCSNLKDEIDGLKAKSSSSIKTHDTSKKTGQKNDNTTANRNDSSNSGLINESTTNEESQNYVIPAENISQPVMNVFQNNSECQPRITSVTGNFNNTENLQDSVNSLPTEENVTTTSNNDEIETVKIESADDLIVVDVESVSVEPETISQNQENVDKVVDENNSSNTSIADSEDSVNVDEVIDIINEDTNSQQDIPDNVEANNVDSLDVSIDLTVDEGKTLVEFRNEENSIESNVYATILCFLENETGKSIEIISYTKMNTNEWAVLDSSDNKVVICVTFHIGGFFSISLAKNAVRGDSNTKEIYYRVMYKFAEDNEDDSSPRPSSIDNHTSTSSCHKDDQTFADCHKDSASCHKDNKTSTAQASSSCQKDNQTSSASCYKNNPTSTGSCYKDNQTSTAHTSSTSCQKDNQTSTASCYRDNQTFTAQASSLSCQEGNRSLSASCHKDNQTSAESETFIPQFSSTTRQSTSNTNMSKENSFYIGRSDSISSGNRSTETCREHKSIISPRSVRRNINRKYIVKSFYNDPPPLVPFSFINHKSAYRSNTVESNSLITTHDTNKRKKKKRSFRNSGITNFMNAGKKRRLKSTNDTLQSLMSISLDTDVIQEDVSNFVRTEKRTSSTLPSVVLREHIRLEANEDEQILPLGQDDDDVCIIEIENVPIEID